MLKDVNFDLFAQVAEISKFLARHKKYVEDSRDCKTCEKIWHTMKEHREQELKMLLDAIKQNMEAGKIKSDEQRKAA